MRILFACKPQADTFARAYTEAMGCEVLITSDPRQVQLAKADVLWLEWGNEWTKCVLARRHEAFTIVRIHDWEIQARWIKFINWASVDLIWFINQQAQADFNAIVQTDTPQMFLPNCVSMDGIDYVAEDSKHLAMYSVSLTPRKRYDRALDLMALLPKEYQLTIRADMYNMDELHAQRETLGLEDRVHFQHRKYDADASFDKSDLNEFFKGKSHIISTSDHEGFHVAVCEGMYAGLVPVVYNWEWGRARDFWKTFVRDTLEGMAEEIVSSRPSRLYRMLASFKYAPDTLVPALLEKIQAYTA